MFSVQMTVAVVLQVSDHLLRGAANPPGSLGLRALIAAEVSKVASFCLDDAAGIVVGERLFRVFGTGFGLLEVAVAQSPWVRGNRAVKLKSCWRVFNFNFEREERKWEWSDKGRFQGFHG